jgi:hypothetical protein
MTDLTRRGFLAGAAATAALNMSLGLAEENRQSRDWSKIRGFNYQPSYGGSGFELWQKFDPAAIDRELGLGKKYFPGINAVRLWLSWDSFLRDPKRFAGDFDRALSIADKYGLVVMPVLFNRWHDRVLDYGGIYIDHFLPKASWVQGPKMFDPFLEAIVGGHKDDRRILAWDLCNEPFSYSCPRQEIPQIADAEFQWLKGLYDQCKRLQAAAPITVGIHPGVPLELIEPISDVLSIHPYYVHNSPSADKAAYEKKLDAEAAFAEKVQKPLLATECCWGSLDDAIRVETIRYTLTQLKKRKIGWLVYLLHHSLIADAHRPEFGPIGFPGYLGFIEADGSLRKGHDVFNEF